MKRRSFLQGFPLAVVAPAVATCSCSIRKLDERRSTLSLADAAAGGGRRFGTAATPAVLDGQAAGRGIIAAECSSITPEWALKWDHLTRFGPRYDFSEADAVVGFARRNGKAVRGHTLIWHRSTPAWAAQLIAQTREWGHIRAHFAAVIGRYGQHVDQWDVVNEPIDVNDRSDGLRRTVFLEAFGRDYIEWAFWTARELAPRSGLYINEYSLEYDTPEEGGRRLALLRLLEDLRRRGVPVTGVGLQAHLDLRKGNVYRRGIYGLLRDISGMGLDIAITELDVVEADVSAPIERRDMLVADEVRRYLDVVLDFGSVRSVSTWGMSDRRSWLRTRPGGNPANRGLPYDENWRPKPMRQALVETLSRARSV